MKRFAQISITFIILISLFIPSGLEFAGQQISRVGEARAADYAWIAYNDVVFRAGQLETDITKYTISSEATSSGLLVDYSTGSNTAVNVAVTTSGTVSYSGTGDSDGTESTEGTDAYNTFHGIVNPIGLIYWSSSTPYLDLTFTNLSAGKTYTFATTANRAGSTTDYQSRISKFTISGIDSATNSSTSTVTEIDPYSVRFSTGENTAAGNVARWTGINPGTDNSFSVRIQGYSSSTSYGPSVFMLAEEAGSTNTAPDAPTLVTPEDNATGVGIPASLQVTVTDPDADIMDVSFYGRPVAAETPAEDFLLIAIPDTQTITQSYPATLTAQFQWIANRYTSPTGDDLVFVTSLGDIVQTANSTTQWQAADAAFDLLDTAGVPYSVGPGNHDEAIYSSTTYYSTYFGSSRFTGKSWYQGYYTGGEDNYNNYSFFTAGGMDFCKSNMIMS